MKITLATLPQATEQEIFDHVVLGLAKQGFEQSIDDDTCAYRSCNGTRRCAAGLCMADAEYERLQFDSNIEGETWEGLIARELVPIEHRSLISALQAAHDSSRSKNPHGMWCELQRLANDFSLDARTLNSEWVA